MIMPDLRLKECMSITNVIAQEIGINQSSVSRELQRNTGHRGYRFKRKRVTKQLRQG